MIILVGGEKGGTGKTTLASNLAVWLANMGDDVMLLDCDAQASATYWILRRNEGAGGVARINSVQKQKGHLGMAIADLRQRYQHCIIDVGGRTEGARDLRTAMSVADLFLCPVRASEMDLWTTYNVSDIVGDALVNNQRLRSYAVLSLAPTNPQTNETEDARQLVQQLPNLALCPVVIRERKIYRDAISAGRGVIEMGNPKATAEINAIGEFCVQATANA